MSGVSIANILSLIVDDNLTEIRDSAEYKMGPKTHRLAQLTLDVDQSNQIGSRVLEHVNRQTFLSCHV